LAKKYCENCREYQPVNLLICPCGGTSFSYVNEESDEPSRFDPNTIRSRGESDREGGFRVSTVTFKAGNFPVVTSNFVPGREIDEVVGVVFSSANRKMGLTITNVASNSFKDAYQDIQLKASQMGGHAVISLAISIERAGPNAIAFSQTVTLLGTAVTLKRK